MTDEADEEVKEKNEEEFEEETEKETKEEEEDDLKYFDTFPTIEELRLVYDGEEGTVLFEKGKEKIVFKMPYKMEMFKHIDFMDIKTDCIPHIVVKCDDDNDDLSRKTKEKIFTNARDGIRIYPDGVTSLAM
nr:hypothetical protein [Tanacetum cinerariifolium]